MCPDRQLKEVERLKREEQRRKEQEAERQRRILEDKKRLVRMLRLCCVYSSPYMSTKCVPWLSDERKHGKFTITNLA